MALSNNAWTRILVAPSTIALLVRATRSSGSSCTCWRPLYRSRYFALRVQFCLKLGEGSTWDGVSVVVVWVSWGSRKKGSSMDFKIWFCRRPFAGRGWWHCRYKKGDSHRREHRWWWLCTEIVMTLCVCVWKRSYLSTRCPWAFRCRYFWWFWAQSSWKTLWERWVACWENVGVLLYEKMSKEWVKRMEDSHAKVDDNITVGVVGVVKYFLGSVK